MPTPRQSRRLLWEECGRLLGDHDLSPEVRRAIGALPGMLDVLVKLIEIADGKALHRNLEDDARAILRAVEG